MRLDIVSLSFPTMFNTIFLTAMFWSSVSGFINSHPAATTRNALLAFKHEQVLKDIVTLPSQLRLFGRKRSFRAVMRSSGVNTEQEITSSTESNNTNNDYDNMKDILGEKFHAKYMELIEYKEEHGDAVVPKRSGSLGNWVNKQRQHYRSNLSGKKSSLNAVRVDALNQVGFVWDATSRQAVLKEDTWDIRFNELKAYKEEHGNCRVPQRYKKNSKLGYWVGHQRLEYQKIENGEGSSQLTIERKLQLKTLDFEWRHRWEELWDTRYEELKEYKRIHGDTRVATTNKDYPSLGTWVSSQRVNYEKRVNGEPSPMTSKRVKLLEELDFVWKVWDWDLSLVYDY